MVMEVTMSDGVVVYGAVQVAEIDYGGRHCKEKTRNLHPVVADSRCRELEVYRDQTVQVAIAGRVAANRELW